VPEQDQQAEAALTARDHQVGRDDHLLRRETVREHPADQGEHQRRQDLRGQHVGQVRRGPGRVQDRERHPHQRERERPWCEHPVGKQQPEIPVPERGEPAGQALPRH